MGADTYSRVFALKHKLKLIELLPEVSPHIPNWWDSVSPIDMTPLNRERLKCGRTLEMQFDWQRAQQEKLDSEGTERETRAFLDLTTIQMLHVTRKKLKFSVLGVTCNLFHPFAP